MEQNKVNTFAAKFKKAFSEAVLNELGKATRYCHRVRQLTPFRNGHDADGLVCGHTGGKLGRSATGVQRTLWLCHGLQALLRPARQAGVCYVHARDGTTVLGNSGDPCARRSAGRRLLGVSSHRHPGWQFVRDQGRPERGLSRDGSRR